MPEEILMRVRRLLGARDQDITPDVNKAIESAWDAGHRDECWLLEYARNVLALRSWK